MEHKYPYFVVWIRTGIAYTSASEFASALSNCGPIARDPNTLRPEQ
jgi:hypothetical protein